jgi:uncharacterized protein (TIGR03435 family)
MADDMAPRMVPKFGLARCLLLGTAGMVAVVSPPASPAQSTASAGPIFEVASVRRHIGKPSSACNNPSGSPICVVGNRVNLQTVTLYDIIMAAYDVQEYQISGGPSWAAERDGDRYDIAAKVDGDAAPSPDHVRLMLQALLAERFQLKLQRETKELSGFNLVVGKDGPKLKEIPKDTPSDGTGKIRTVSMERIVKQISHELARPVFDKTGLAGPFDSKIVISFFFEMEVAVRGGNESIPTLIQEQLGLKLEAAKINSEILVIDHAQKASEN